MEVYYIFDDEENVIAIFTEESFARDYLYHLGVTEDNCKIGVLSKNIFDFQQHDAKYHTLQESSLVKKIHQDCKRYRRIDDSVGYCFLMDEKVSPYEQSCTMIEERK